MCFSPCSFSEDGEDLKDVSLKRIKSLASVVSILKSWPGLLSDENMFRNSVS